MNSPEEIIRLEAEKSAGPLDMTFFKEHVTVMRAIALDLAAALNADREIVEAAAWLHDIAAIRDYSGVARHHLGGADMAREILPGIGYSGAATAKIAECIELHSVPLAIGKGTPESVCISNADAVSQIINPAYWLYYAFCVRNLSFEEGTAWYRGRIESHFTALIPPAQERCRKKYEALRVALPVS